MSVRPAIGWLLVGALIAFLAWRDAHAYKLRLESCGTYATMVYNIAVVRDLGADESKHEALIAKMAAGSSEAWIEFLHREVKRIYADRRVTPEDMRLEAYDRCIRNLGDLGDPS